MSASRRILFVMGVQAWALSYPVKDQRGTVIHPGDIVRQALEVPEESIPEEVGAAAVEFFGWIEGSDKPDWIED